MRTSKPKAAIFLDDSYRVVELDLPVFLVKEGKYWTALCPALDLSSYARTEAGAQKRFEEALRIFIDETTARGTLEKELLRLGWSLRLRPQPEYMPPVMPPSLVEMLGSPGARRAINERVSIPV